MPPPCFTTSAPSSPTTGTTSTRRRSFIINGLPGFTPREIALVALLARYHRKGRPGIAGYEAVLKSKNATILRRLAAILRLAEFLERGRNAAVEDVITNWTDDSLRLTLIADEHPAVELWETERNARPLVEEAFERSLRLDSIAAPIEYRSLSETEEPEEGDDQ